MSEQHKLYNNAQRKNELVEQLSQLLSRQLEASETIENKAYELLKISSATLGVVAGLQVVLGDAQQGNIYWVAVGFVLIMYSLHVLMIILVIRPMNWHFVPGGTKGKTTYETLMQRYIPITDDEYLNQLIADYAGVEKSSTGNKVDGAITVAQRNTTKKRRYFNVSVIFLMLLMIGIVIMSIIAAAG